MINDVVINWESRQKYADNTTLSETTCKSLVLDGDFKETYKIIFKEVQRTCT